MPNPDEGITQPRFYCGIPRCSPGFAMMLQILAVKSALCTGLPPRRLVGHGRPKTCLLNACTCEGTRARPGFSNSNARSTYTPCAWRKQDRASSLQKLNNRPPGQVPSGGIYAFDVRQTLTPYLLPYLLLLEATSFWLSLSLALSRSLSLSISLSPSGPVLCVQTCMGPARLNGHALGHRRLCSSAWAVQSTARRKKARRTPCSPRRCA